MSERKAAQLNSFRTVALPLLQQRFPGKDLKPFSVTEEYKRKIETEGKEPWKNLAFFFSHRGPDAKEQIVRPVKDILDEVKVPFFFDQSPNENGIAYMRDNEEEIGRGLHRCHVGVVFVSEGFLESSYCGRELHTLLQRELDENVNIIFPVFLRRSLLNDPNYECIKHKCGPILDEGVQVSDFIREMLLPALLDLPAIQHMESIQQAKASITRDQVQCMSKLVENLEARRFWHSHFSIQQSTTWGMLKQALAHDFSKVRSFEPLGRALLAERKQKTYDEHELLLLGDGASVTVYQFNKVTSEDGFSWHIWYDDDATRREQIYIEARHRERSVREHMCDDKSSFVAKCLFLGNSGVGKTSMMFRFVRNAFCESMSTTIACDYESVNKANVKFQIWEIGGQERYRSFVEPSTKGKNVIVIVFDFSIRGTFKALRNWMKQVSEHSGLPIIIVGNKIDRADREVTIREAKQFCAAIGAPLHVVSCKTGEGVPELFQTIALYARKPSSANITITRDENTDEKTPKKCCN